MRVAEGDEALDFVLGKESGIRVLARWNQLCCDMHRVCNDFCHRTRRRLKAGDLQHHVMG